MIELPSSIMPAITAKNFNLKETLDSGQIFRYWPHENGYIIGQRDSIFFVRQENERLKFDGCKKKFLANFLGLDDPVDKIITSFNRHEHIKRAAENYPGIRILKQDPWECMIGFICSSASNIPKIKSNMDGIARLFGKPLALKNTRRYSFPNPGEINNLDKIRSAGTGFRARFIISANKTVTDDWLAELRRMHYHEAKKELTKIPGVGSKIADCVLLFSLGFREPFPVDVWIQRAMNEGYPQTLQMNLAGIAEYGRKMFGNNAGYAQQYLYHWRRNKKY